MVKLLFDSLSPTNNDQMIKVFKTDLRKNLIKRFSEKEELEEYAIATLLDPRYKKRFFMDDFKAESSVCKLLNKL